MKQYQDLQRALDQGGVYLQAPGKGGKKYHSLLAEYQDGNGQWWLYAINAKNMRTKTIFESGPQHRIHKLNQPDMTLIKEWDPRRWEEK